MSDNIFDLVYHNLGCDVHYFFDGPRNATEEDFEKICDSLLPMAGYKAALKQSAPTGGDWIVWSDVVEALVSLLEEQGYQRIYLDSYYLNCSGVIGLYGPSYDERLGFAYRVIFNYNKQLEEKIAKAQKDKKKALFKKRVVQIIK